MPQPQVRPIADTWQQRQQRQLHILVGVAPGEIDSAAKVSCPAPHLPLVLLFLEGPKLTAVNCGWNSQAAVNEQNVRSVNLRVCVI